ncbi:MAG: alpha/beta hydrolase [Solobacterium sp.]|nr:alpha/beta hydrolase [Solobacterium sp.]
MYYSSSGLQLYYETVGQGKPLIMIHGNSEDHTIFDRASEVLAPWYTCYLPDSRGHGRNEKCRELHYLDVAGDLLALMEQNDLNDVIVYGFSDGGIIGLLAAMQSDRISRLIVSGANCTPEGVVKPVRTEIAVINRLMKDPKLTLMETEPHITPEELGRIKARTLVLAGQHDVILESETRLIAASIPGSELRILPAEDHGSYIVHNRKIGDILFAWLSRTQS